MWQAFYSLVGVILGGVLTGVFNLVVARSAVANTQRLELLARMREEYFQAVDAILDVRQQFTAFNASWTPYTGNNKPGSGKDSDNLLPPVFKALGLFKIRLYHLKVIGSAQMIDVVTKVEGRIHQYFEDVAADLPILKAVTFRALMDDVDVLIEQLIDTARVDLGVYEKPTARKSG